MYIKILCILLEILLFLKGDKMKEIVLPQIVTIGIYNSDVALKNKTITKKYQI